MKCEDIMKTEVQYVLEGDSVEEAARRMRDHNIGFLPICRRDGEILGTITDRDITVRVVAEQRPRTVSVDEVMTQEVVACRPEDDISVAEQLMTRFKKSRLLVTDEDGRLEGVISLSDIAKVESGDRAAETLRAVAGRETHT